jgi:DNA adenine methylase
MGGKKQLIKDGLLSWFPRDCKVYIEPFGGSFQVLLSKSWREPYECINDLDSDLVHFYRTVKWDPKKLVSFINSVPKHEAILIGLRQDLARGSLSGVERAAAFFLVTRSSFNGIVDSGFARYAHSVIAPMETEISLNDVMAVYNRLANVEIRSTDYRRLLSAACKKVDGGMFVYMDPPYDDTEGYSTLQGESTFGKHEHRQLAEYCAQLDQLGAKWMQTNSDTPFLRELYGAMRRPDGSPVVTMITREVYYSFSGVASKRRATNEIIFGNFDFTKTERRLF